MKKAAAPKPTTTSEGIKPLGYFGSALLDIGWQLAITVIGFLWIGSYADRHLGTKPVFTLLGFLLVVVSFFLIVRRVVAKLPTEFGGKRT